MTRQGRQHGRAAGRDWRRRRTGQRAGLPARAPGKCSQRAGGGRGSSEMWPCSARRRTHRQKAATRRPHGRSRPEPADGWGRLGRRLPQHRLRTIDGDDSALPECRHQLGGQTAGATAEIEDPFAGLRCQTPEDAPAPFELRVRDPVISFCVPIRHKGARVLWARVPVLRVPGPGLWCLVLQAL